MLDYARQRAIETLKSTRKVVLATNGPAGVQVGEFPCQAVGLELYLFVPRTSTHLFNLECEAAVSLLAAGWELSGEAQIICACPMQLELDVLDDSSAKWCELVRVDPERIQIRRPQGWGYLETIDLKSR